MQSAFPNQSPPHLSPLYQSISSPPLSPSTNLFCYTVILLLLFIVCSAMILPAKLFSNNRPQYKIEMLFLLNSEVNTNCLANVLHGNASYNFIIIAHENAKLIKLYILTTSHSFCFNKHCKCLRRGMAKRMKISKSQNNMCSIILFQLLCHKKVARNKEHGWRDVKSESQRATDSESVRYVEREKRNKLMLRLIICHVLFLWIWTLFYPSNSFPNIEIDDKICLKLSMLRSKMCTSNE